MDQIYTMPLRADQGFLPQFDDIPPAVLEQSKMMVLSYPNNPPPPRHLWTFGRKPWPFAKPTTSLWYIDFPYGDITFTGGQQPPVSVRGGRP